MSERNKKKSNVSISTTRVKAEKEQQLDLIFFYKIKMIDMFLSLSLIF